MRRHARALAALVLVCASVVGARTRAEAPPRPVKPGEAFGGSAGLEVRAPGGDGWVVRESATELLFGRPGATKRETTVATVSFFELPESESASAERFLAFMRKQNEAEMPAARFANPLHTFGYSETRGVACVHYFASAIDELAPGGALPQAMYALYCRYPLRTDFGLALVYSQRAKTIDADLAQQAHVFFEGVRVRGGAKEHEHEGAPAQNAEGARPSPAPSDEAEREPRARE
jgi:hypothetical protein